MAQIKLKGVTKRWGAVWGVRKIDIEIADKELLVLLGPSGCGKTTTMRMIAGLEDPSEGEITFDGEVMNAVDARDRDVAMVFQGYALYPNMSIYENIRFPLRMRNVPKDKQDELVRRAAKMVELSDYLNRKPGALSGGQRQRAALARAVVREPQIFLMDEPLSNLDAQLRQAMRVQIKHIQRELQITTVYVTHDQIEAMTLADRIVVMQGGAVQQVGTPDEIYSDPANTFVASFIGAPPMNLIDGMIKDGNFVADHVEVPDVGIKTTGQIKLGIRPEDCAVVSSAEQQHNMKGEVYGVEPTGDMTVLTLRVGEKYLEIKADRDYRSELGVQENVVFDTDRLYFFDSQSGERVR